MNPFVKKTLSTFFPRYFVRRSAYNALIKDTSSYLYATGWLQSLTAGRPVSNCGKPIPWMNFTVIAVLAERLNKSMSLFEYGSGYSTLFYAERVGSVDSVEYDQEWFGTIREQLPDNANLIFVERSTDGDYCRTITRMGKKYDVVIVDGRDRVNCIAQSIGALSERGVILLDDSQREKYRAGIELATAKGFRALNLQGLKATGTTVESTTILYRADNCLGI